MRKARIAAMLSALCLCTGCTAQESGSSLAEESSSAETSASEASSAAETSTALTTAAASQTTAAAETTVSSTEETSAVTTTAAAPASVWDSDAYTAYCRGKTAYVLKECTGRVRASSGLILRKEPSSENSARLCTIPDKTELKLLKLVGEKGKPEKDFLFNRWYEVEYQGKRGYISARYTDAVCKAAPESLSNEDRAALGAFLYGQGAYLDWLFTVCGGTIARGTEPSDVYDEYERVLPAGLTIKKLREAYRQYFTANFPDYFDELYMEAEGSLWVMGGYGDNILYDYSELRDVAAAGNRLTYTVRSYNDAQYVGEVPELPPYYDDKFTVVYDAAHGWRIDSAAFY